MNTNKSSQITFFLGTQGIFSATVFGHLLQKGVSISQVFCASIAPADSPKNLLPVSQPARYKGLDTLAQSFGIPVTYVANQSELDLIDIQGYTKAEFMLVGCFPYCLPESFINWPNLACLNIHPSLLPKYRGPDPIFWQLQNGESHTGVSLHLITSRLDAGPILNQKKCLIDDGSSRQNIEITLAIIGAEIFRSLLENDFSRPVTSVKQDESQASYQSNPSITDYTISLDWDARRTFNFIRGTSSPTGYYSIVSNDKLVKIKSTI